MIINNIKVIYKAFLNAFNGLRIAISTERAFIQEIILCIVLLPVPLLMELELNAKLWMIFSLLLLLIIELLNTAIEAVVDLNTKEYNELAKRAKDTAAAAVLIALINVGITWCIIIFNYYKIFWN